MVAAVPTPPPPEGSWMLEPEHKVAWDCLTAAIKDKRSSPPADSYDEYTFGAPVTHITQLRALEQVYLHAGSVGGEDLVDFLGFAEAVTYAVSDHLRLEEDFIYLTINALTKSTLWQPVCDDRALLAPPLLALWLYIRHCRTLIGVPPPSDIVKPWLTSLDDIPETFRTNLDFGPEATWDGQAVQCHMDAFMRDYVKHIPLEGEASMPEHLRGATEAEIGKLLSDVTKKAFKTINLHIQPPLAWTHNDMSDIRHFFVARPWLNRILTWWFGSRHAAWWRFSAYPQNLA